MNKEINIWGFVGAGNQDNLAPKPRQEEIEECELFLARYTNKGPRGVSVYGLKHRVQPYISSKGVDIGRKNYIHTGALLQAAINLGYKVDDTDHTGWYKITGFIYCSISRDCNF